MDKESYLNNPQKIIMVSPELFDSDKSDFIAYASGNGMIRSGISDGDTLIFKNTSKLKDGEIGAFIMKGKETAVKRYFKRNDIIILEFDDGIQPPMIFNEKDVEIVGKLTYIIKKI